MPEQAAEAASFVQRHQLRHVERSAMMPITDMAVIDNALDLQRSLT